MTAPPLDRDAADEWLDFVHAEHEGWACLALSSQHWRQLFFRWPDERETLLDSAMAQAPGADVYVGMLLHSDRTRKANTALPGRALWADVDHAYTPTQAELLQRTPAFRVVKSGTPRHSHLYLLLDQLLPVDELVIQNQRMAKRFEADAKWDASTVLRLPGTFNHKGGDLRPVGAFVPAGEMEELAAAVSTDDLSDLFGSSEAPAPATESPVELVPEPVAVSEAMQRKLDEEPKDDTSAQCSAFVRYCLETGHTDNEIAWLAPQAAAYQAYVAKDPRHRSIMRDVARQLAKFRPNHTHPGLFCDRASCPNKPDWQDGEQMTDREQRLRRKVDELLLHDEARQQVAALKAEAQFRSPGHRASLAEDLMAQPDELPETIARLHRTGANAVIAAQYKAGKTTLAANLVRALVDGEDFLGQFPVRFEGRVAFFNYELDELQMIEWLGRVGIRNTDRVTTVNLRGQRLPLIAETAQRWAIEFMLEHAVQGWIIDPFARAFAGCGNENDNGEVGAFLDSVDEIKRLGGVSDVWVTHHFGRKDHDDGQEHGRGATRLDDWPDVRWLLTRQHDHRFLRIEGRGVDLEETQLLWEPSGKLALGTGSRKQAKQQEEQFASEFVVRLVLDAVKREPGINRRGIERAMRGTSKNKVGAAIEAAIEQGKVRVEVGKNNARHHFAVAEGALL